MIVELLRAGTPDLARRWISALLLVPEGEREGVVASVERRIVEMYDPLKPVMSPESGVQGAGESPASEEGGTSERQVTVVYPPVAKEGYTEQLHRTFGVVEGKGKAKRGAASEADVGAKGKKKQRGA